MVNYIPRFLAFWKPVINQKDLDQLDDSNFLQLELVLRTSAYILLTAPFCISVVPVSILCFPFAAVAIYHAEKSRITSNLNKIACERFHKGDKVVDSQTMEYLSKTPAAIKQLQKIKNCDLNKVDSHGNYLFQNSLINLQNDFRNSALRDSFDKIFNAFKTYNFNDASIPHCLNEFMNLKNSNYCNPIAYREFFNVLVSKIQDTSKLSNAFTHSCWYFAAGKSIKLCRILQKKLLDPNCKNRHGNTPIVEAIATKDFFRAYNLLKSGVQFPDPSSSIQVEIDFSNTNTTLETVKTLSPSHKQFLDKLDVLKTQIESSKKIEKKAKQYRFLPLVGRDVNIENIIIRVCMVAIPLNTAMMIILSSASAPESLFFAGCSVIALTATASGRWLHNVAIKQLNQMLISKFEKSVPNNDVLKKISHNEFLFNHFITKKGSLTKLSNQGENLVDHLYNDSLFETGREVLTKNILTYLANKIKSIPSEIEPVNYLYDDLLKLISTGNCRGLEYILPHIELSKLPPEKQYACLKADKKGCMTSLLLNNGIDPNSKVNENSALAFLLEARLAFNNEFERAKLLIEKGANLDEKITLRPNLNKPAKETTIRELLKNHTNAAFRTLVSSN